ncbi:hypothetical protein Pelo_7792 [Pelomyxa schiedti]|nr:hypothetical protein Pelo_7792 [Pelomyxa schiedti]
MSGDGSNHTQQATTTTSTLLGGATPLLTPYGCLVGVAVSPLRVHAQVKPGRAAPQGRVISSGVWVMSPAAYSQAPGTLAFADRMSPGMLLNDTVLLIPNYNYDDRRKYLRDQQASETVVQSFSVAPGTSGSSISSGQLQLPAAITNCVDSVRKDDGDDDSRHMAAVGEVARLTIETVGSTLRCIGLAAQLALSLSSTCSCLRRVCDVDTLWRALFMSHLSGGAPTVSLSHPEYSGCGLWKTLYKVFCASICTYNAAIFIKDALFARPRNFCSAVEPPKILAFPLSSSSAMSSTNVPPFCHFDCPGRVVAPRKSTRRAILLSERKRFWDITFDYGPPVCSRPPVVRHFRNTGKNLQCYLNDAEWIDIHVDGKTYHLHSPRRLCVDFKLVHLSPETKLKVTMNPTVRHAHTGVPTPVRVDEPLEFRFLIEHTMDGNSTMTQECNLNFKDKQFSREVVLPEGQPIRRSTIIKVTGPENIEICGVGSTVELTYPIPELLSPPGTSFSFEVGSNPPCDQPPTVQVRNCKSGEIIPHERGQNCRFVTKWQYSTQLNASIIGTEVEAFAQYGPDKCSLFKCMVPSVKVEHITIDNHQQVVLCLCLTDWCEMYSSPPKELNVVLVSSSSSPEKPNIQNVQWMQFRGSPWNSACIVKSVPIGPYSVVISTKNGESQFPVDVVPKDPPPTFVWSRPGTTCCNSCDRTIITGSRWSCRPCDYDLCDYCNTPIATVLHPHPLREHRFKTILSIYQCNVCGTSFGSGDYCLSNRLRDIDYCLACIPENIDPASFCLNLF